MAETLSSPAAHFARPEGSPSVLPPGSTVFCDFDGPIADVSERYYSTYCLALTATRAFFAKRHIILPIRRLTKAQFWHMKQNRVPDETIADWSGLSGHQVTIFLNHVDSLVNQSTLLHHDCLQPRVRIALRTLKQHRVRIVIVTLRQSSQVFDFLNKYDLATAFNQIYGADHSDKAYANRTEHKIAQLEEAIADQQRLGVDTTHSWMLGDTEADICAGQHVGIPTVALSCGIRSSLYLKGFMPTRLCRDFFEATRCLTPNRAIAA